MKYAPYSFSRINTFVTCPRKFKYTYIDKADKVPQNMEPLLKGGAVHHILEHYPHDSTHKLAPQYKHIVNNFVETNLGKKLMFRDSTREFSFGLKSDFTPCEYKDKDAIFRGSIDYMYIEDGMLFLVDWKTGKQKELKWQSFDQLLFYALYFFIVYEKIDIIKISYVYIEHENVSNDLSLERKYLDNYKIKLAKLISSIEADEDFAKTTKNWRLCDWCEFQMHCEEDS